MSTTIRDVAAVAGVSPATVSRVLNGKVVVAPELSERVRAAVDSLGYRPNGLARGLRRRATMVVGVVISDVTNPFFTSMVRGFEDVAQAAGYSVVLANSDEDLEKERCYLEVAVAEQMAGVALCPTSSTRTDVSVLDSYGIPVVTVDRELRGGRVDSVSIDNNAAARQATEHLITQGCRHIAFISGPTTASTGERRLAGYRAALRSAKLTAAVRRADFRVEGGYRAAQELLDAAPETDGMLVSNNLMAVGALQALQERGVALPDDLAFASFDGVIWAQILHPTLTVMEQPTYQIGRRAAELLLARIAEPDTPVQRVVLPAELRVGQSSAGVSA